MKKKKEYTTVKMIIVFSILIVGLSMYGGISYSLKYAIYANDESIKNEVGASVNAYLDQNTTTSSPKKINKDDDLSEILGIFLETYKKAFIPLTTAEQNLIESDYLEPSSFKTTSNMVDVMLLIKTLEKEVDNYENIYEEASNDVLIQLQKSVNYSPEFKKEFAEGFKIGTSVYVTEGIAYIKSYQVYIDSIIMLYEYTIEHSNLFSVSFNFENGREQVIVETDEAFDFYDHQTDVINNNVEIYINKSEIFNARRSKFFQEFDIDKTKVDSFFAN